MDKITFDKLASCGPIIQLLFQNAYPNGLTLEQLRDEASGHGYLRRILAVLEKEEK